MGCGVMSGLWMWGAKWVSKWVRTGVGWFGWACGFTGGLWMCERMSK